MIEIIISRSTTTHNELLKNEKSSLKNIVSKIKDFATSEFSDGSVRDLYRDSLRGSAIYYHENFCLKNEPKVYLMGEFDNSIVLTDDQKDKIRNSNEKLILKAHKKDVEIVRSFFKLDKFQKFVKLSLLLDVPGSIWHGEGKRILTQLLK